MENTAGIESGTSILKSLDISVRNPITHNTWDKGRYTSYEIAVNTSNKSFCLSSSTTRRRYSEFEWLRKTLSQHHPLLIPPQLPPKKFFGDRFDPNYVAFRMKALEDFLNSLLLEKVFLSDTTMHLFLQTNLSKKEIKDYIEGKISAMAIDSLWLANGVKENCKEFCNISEKETGDWTHVLKEEKRDSKKLDVPPSAEESRDSNNSDISSLSDDNEEHTEYPSLSLVSKNTTNETIAYDSGVSSSHSKLDSPHQIQSAEQSFNMQVDSGDLQREAKLVSSAKRDKKKDNVRDLEVTNKFSINYTD